MSDTLTDLSYDVVLIDGQPSWGGRVRHSCGHLLFTSIEEGTYHTERAIFARRFFVRFEDQNRDLLCHIVFSNFHSLEALEACLEACPEVFCSNSHGLATLELETCIEVCLQLYFIF